MLKIGITGGIGSGKTLISKVFETLGVPTFSADDCAKKIYSDAGVRAKIINLFGTSIYNANEIDKKQLAEKIFNNQEYLTQVNNIVHPAVYELFETWCANQKSPYVLFEAAILFESGADKFMDKIICITAPESLQIARCIVRDDSNSAQIIQRIKNQMSDAERVLRSNFVIVNDDKTAVLPQILKIHREITEN